MIQELLQNARAGRPVDPNEIPPAIGGGAAPVAPPPAQPTHIQHEAPVRPPPPPSHSTVASTGKTFL